MCTVLVAGGDDVAPSYSVGVLTRCQVGRGEGSRGLVKSPVVKIGVFRSSTYQAIAQ